MKWILAVSAILVAGGWWLHVRSTEPGAIEVTAERRPPPAAVPQQARPSLAPDASDDREVDDATAPTAWTLPTEDVEWVTAEVARWEAARTLTRDERDQLVAELTSIRTFAVLERQEPLPYAPEEAP